MLLRKLEAIREEMSSDKVFDVIGRLLRNRSLRGLMRSALGGDGAAPDTGDLNRLEAAGVRELTRQEERRFGSPGEVGRALPQLRAEAEPRGVPAPVARVCPPFRGEERPAPSPRDRGRP